MDTPSFSLLAQSQHLVLTRTEGGEMTLPTRDMEYDGGDTSIPFGHRNTALSSNEQQYVRAKKRIRLTSTTVLPYSTTTMIDTASHNNNNSSPFGTTTNRRMITPRNNRFTYSYCSMDDGEAFLPQQLHNHHESSSHDVGHFVTPPDIRRLALPSLIHCHPQHQHQQHQQQLQQQQHYFPLDRCPFGTLP